MVGTNKKEAKKRSFGRPDSSFFCSIRGSNNIYNLAGSFVFFTQTSSIHISPSLYIFIIIWWVYVFIKHRDNTKVEYLITVLFVLFDALWKKFRRNLKNMNAFSITFFFQKKQMFIYQHVYVKIRNKISDHFKYLAQNEF